jgi:arylsulfatase A-like enzyme
MEHRVVTITMFFIFLLIVGAFWLTLPSVPYPGYDEYESNTSGSLNKIDKEGNLRIKRENAAVEPEEQQVLPNIILITIETTRADHLGAYGYHRDTSPNMDEFAAENIRFNKCYVQSPATVVNLTGLLTSTYPGENGVYAQNQVLSNDWETITEILKQKGYYTIGVVSNHLLPRINGVGTAQGFNHYDNLHNSPASTVTKHVLSNLREVTKPFFLWVHYFDPHTPYNPPEAFFKKVSAMNKPKNENLVLPLIDYGSRAGLNLKRIFAKDYRPSKESKGVRKKYIYDLYDSEILYVDAEIGKLLAFLKDNNQYENSLIIVTSDHGESLVEHDLYCQHCLDLYRGTTEVPLMIHLPGYKKGGQVVEGPASTIDIVPTILDVSKIPQPASIRGMSLLSFLQEEGDFKTRDMMLMTGWWDGLSLKLRKMPDQHPDFAIISGPYKYIIHSMEAYMVAYPWELVHFWRKALTNRLKADEMYDLAKDPLETLNLRNNNSETAERLKKALFSSSEFSAYINRRIKNEKIKKQPLSEKQKEKLKSLGYL